MKRLIPRRKRFLFLTGAGMILVTLIFSGIVFAQDDASPPYMNPSRILSAARLEMTIVEKRPGNVLAGETRFTVLPETVIEMEGKPLSFKEMPVPCRVIGYYEKHDNQDPELVKIEIKKIASNATTDWAPPMPE